MKIKFFYNQRDCYSTKFISYKDLKPFMADLKLVYKADTEDLALTALEDLEEKWGKKYPASIGSWRNNWTQLSTYFKYPSEIRKLIYTTNSIENFNRQLRKVTKSKTIFPTVKTAQLYFLTKTYCPSALVESFFCDSKSDYKIGKNYDKIGKLIAEAIAGVNIN